MSVFGFPAARVASTARVQSPSEEVTGAYEPYVSSLEAAIQASDYSVASVEASANSVLAQAIGDGIPQGDLLALASFTGVATSSATEWHDYAANGGFDSGGCGDPNSCWEYSIFGGRQDGGDKAKKVIAADIGGCLSSVKSWGTLRALLLTPAWEAVAGYCGVRAAIASGVAIYLL